MKKKLNDTLERVNALSSILHQLRQICSSPQKNHSYASVHNEARNQLDALTNYLEQIMETQ